MRYFKSAYLFSISLAVVVGAGLRFWLFSGLNHHYYQGGTLAWHASHALSILQGRPLLVDPGFVKSLQEAQLLSNRIIDPQDFPLGLKQNPISPWPSTDVPGYGFILSAFWFLLPKRYIFIQIFQILLDLLSIILIAETGKRFFNRTIGGISSWLYALWPIPAAFSCIAHRDYWGIFGIILAVFFLAFLLKSRTWLPVLGAGVSLAVLSWIRPVWTGMMLFIPVFIWVDQGWGRAWRAFSILATCFLVLFFLPLSLMNLKLHNRPFVSPVGLFLWESLGEDKNPYGFSASDSDAWEYASSVKGIPPDSLEITEANEILLQRVIEVGRKDPGFITKSLLIRGWRILTLGYSIILFLPVEKGLTHWEFPFMLMRYLHKLSWLLALVGFILTGASFGYRKTALLWAPSLSIFFVFWPTRFTDPRFFFYALFPFLFFVSGAVWVVYKGIKFYENKNKS